MSGSVLLRAGPVIYRVPSGDGAIASLALGNAPEVARALAAGDDPVVSEPFLRWARAAPSPLRTADPGLHAILERGGVPVATAPWEELRRALERLPDPPLRPRREFALGLGRARLEQALRAPGETLVALAREEERVERALGREDGVLDQWLVGRTGALADYRRELEGARTRLAGHLEALTARVEVVARSVVPNLAAVVGPRVAARLVAAAGSRALLARLPASRIQLLGARRRPGDGHGPRFGLLFRGARMDDVPLERQGRYARSLAALAAIAVRIDEHTQRDATAELLARRDRRIAQLRRG